MNTFRVLFGLIVILIIIIILQKISPQKPPQKSASLINFPKTEINKVFPSPTITPPPPILLAQTKSEPLPKIKVEPTPITPTYFPTPTQKIEEKKSRVTKKKRGKKKFKDKINIKTFINKSNYSKRDQYHPKY